MNNISGVFDLKKFCDELCVEAKLTKPGSPEMIGIVNRLAGRLLKIDILPKEPVIFESLLLIISETDDPKKRKRAHEVLQKQLFSLFDSDPETAGEKTIPLLSSLFMKDELKTLILPTLIQSPSLRANEFYRLARETHHVTSVERAFFVGSAIDSLKEEPYDFVMAMREMIDTVGRGVCEVVDMVDSMLHEYTNSVAYIAEALEREHGVTIQSIPGPANA